MIHLGNGEAYARDQARAIAFRYVRSFEALRRFKWI
jgi:hypothetical protein